MASTTLLDAELQKPYYGSDMYSDHPSPDTGVKKENGCPVCLTAIQSSTDSSYNTIQNCGTLICRSCMLEYLKFKINLGRADITCPHCDDPISQTLILSMIESDDDVLQKYYKFTVANALSGESSCHWCPGVDCQYVVIAGTNGICQPIACDNQKCTINNYCFYCGLEYSGNNHECVVPQFDMDALLEDTNTSNRYHFCPTCHEPILKTSGTCNDMVCIKCLTNFCFYCGKQVKGKDHYGPFGNGCPYYGDTPWEKGDLKQARRCMYLATPFLLPIVVVLALPMFLYVIPADILATIDKVYSTPKNVNKVKMKRCMKSMGLLGGVILAPIIWAIVIVLGIPLLLVAIYIYLPIKSHQHSLSNQKSTVDAADIAGRISKIAATSSESVNAPFVSQENEKPQSVTIDINTINHEK